MDEEPKVILLYGSDLSVQREVGAELSDLLSRSRVLGFASPLRESYRATFDMPRLALLEAEEERKVADWASLFRGFLREFSGKSVLGRLAIQTIEREWWAHPFFIIDDGCDTYMEDVKEVTKAFKKQILVVNFSATPLKSNSSAILEIPQKEPEEMAQAIRDELQVGTNQP